MFSVDARVIMKSFNGTRITPASCDPRENYWLLIGERGTVVEPQNDKGRVLVRFDTSVVRKGLHCHNPTPNSLYILTSDLDILPQT